MLLKTMSNLNRNNFLTKMLKIKITMPNIENLKMENIRMFTNNKIMMKKKKIITIF